MGPLGGKIAQSYAAGGRRGGLYAAIGQFLASFHREPGSLFERTTEHEHCRDRSSGRCVVHGRLRRNHLERLLLSERLARTLACAAGRVRRLSGGNAAAWLFPGRVVGDFIETYSGIIALVILGFIGGNMIKEGACALRGGGDGEEEVSEDGNALTLKVILVQAVATSIDAFAVGVSLRAVSVAVAPAVSIIGVTTLLCCIVALAIGKRFGHLLGDRAQIVGGVVLVLIGIKAMF